MTRRIDSPTNSEAALSELLQDDAIGRLIREADHRQIKMLLDYYLRIIGPFPPYIAEIAAEWERVEEEKEAEQPNVLAITKRTAHLCANQSQLYPAGYRLVVATTVSAARGMINSLGIKAVIVCRDSWSNHVVQDIAFELVNAIEVPVMMHCPGCDNCDETAGKPGTLRDTAPLTKLITAID